VTVTLSLFWIIRSFFVTYFLKQVGVLMSNSLRKGSNVPSFRSWKIKEQMMPVGDLPGWGPVLSASVI